MAKVAGTAYITIDSRQYKLRGNINVMLGTVSRESVNGLDGHHGIKVVPQMGVIEADLTDEGELDLNILEGLTDVTVQVDLINGKKAILRNANQMNHISLNADDGKFTVKFEGPSGEWIVSQETPSTTSTQTTPAA